MDAAWGIVGAVALIGGGLCYWVWRARPSNNTRDTLAGYVIGDQMAGVRWVGHRRDDDGQPEHYRGVDILRVRDGKVAEKLVYAKR